MKKTLLLILLTSHCAFAQYDVEDKNKWSFSIAYNSVEAQMDQKLFDTWVGPSANYYAYYGDKKDKSYSFCIIPKYQIAKGVFLRFEFGITKIDLESHYNGSGDTTAQNQPILGSFDGIADGIIQQKIYRYCLGVQWNFIKVKFIEAYCGASFNYFNYKIMDWSEYIEDGASVHQLPDYKNQTYKSTTPGGFAAGIGTLAGVNIYLTHCISLGGEFSYSLLYYKLGGVQSGVWDVYENISSHYYHDHLVWSIHNNASEGIQFSKVMPSFKISIHF
jgi:hypothetical protein